MKSRLTLGIVAAALFFYVVSPDPFPVVIDDVIAALGSAAAILAMIFKKGK